MKHNPKIHTQIHDATTRPVHEGIYVVVDEGFDTTYGFAMFKDGTWRWVGYFHTRSEERDAYRYAIQHQENIRGDLNRFGVRWYGLRKKPKGMK